MLSQLEQEVDLESWLLLQHRSTNDVKQKKQETEHKRTPNKE